MVCRGLLFMALCTVLWQGCYSLKGVSIAPEIETFFVEQFQNGVNNAPPDIGQRFSDDLKNRILRNSRLDYTEDTPDIEFSGVVRSYGVQAIAPERDADDDAIFGSALNRLNITIEVEYINNSDEEDTWKKNFTLFEDFDNQTVLSDVEEQLITNIFDQLTQQVFNESFTNW